MSAKCLLPIVPIQYSRCVCVSKNCLCDYNRPPLCPPLKHLQSPPQRLLIPRVGTAEFLRFVLQWYVLFSGNSQSLAL